MKKNIAVISGLLFFIWILPLGVFIKPGQEQLACNGQRAICLCSSHLAKNTEQTAVKVFSPGASHAHEKSPSSGSSHDFLASNSLNDFIEQQSALMFSPVASYQFNLVKALDPVPKV
jgi:hypothetical protein